MFTKKKLIFIIALININLISNNNNLVYKYQKLLAHDPTNFEALFNLANEFFNKKQFTQATIHYKKALRTQPENVSTLFNLSLALLMNNKLDQAKEHLTKIITINPKHPKALLTRAEIFEKQENIDAAISDCQKSAKIHQKPFNTYIKLANLFKKQKDYENSIIYYKKAIELKPENISLRFKLGHIFTSLGLLDEAIEQYEKILEFNPKHYQVIHNIGYCLKVKGKVDEAIQMYQKALEINPKYEASIYAEALAYLYKGDFETGWQKYAWRLKKEKRNSDKLRSWIKDSTLKNKTVYIMPEGGLGDTIQFIRYAEKLKKSGARVVVSVQKPLRPLISNCPYIDVLLSSKNKIKQYDDITTTMSLPAIFGSTEETIPKNIPYIFPDKTLIEKWKSYFKENDSFKIGLCWGADLKNDQSRVLSAHRSIPLKKLEKLSTLNNTQFYSLQKKDCVDQLENIPENFTIHTFGHNFDNESGPFMDTAAIIKQLDLVITVDTSIAHLAGALGTPVFLMLPYNTDWRWIEGRKDSPWYPKMKIFKQPKAFDWESVVQEIFEELSKKNENNI